MRASIAGRLHSFCHVCLASVSRILCRSLVVSVSCVLYCPLVAHLCYMFYVACSVSHAHRTHVFCITRSSRIRVLCSMLHVLCRALVAHMFSVSRARRAHIFCIARSSCICRALVAYLCCRLCVTRSSRLCNVCCVSCACVPSHTIITLVFGKFSVVHAQIFAHVPGSHDVPIICTRQAGSKQAGS